MFSCEFCKNFKTTFIKEHVLTTASMWPVFLEQKTQGLQRKDYKEARITKENWAKNFWN